MDEIFYVREPITATLEGALVSVEVKSGAHVFCFEMPISAFLKSFAVSARIAHEWHGGRPNVVDLDKR